MGLNASVKPSDKPSLHRKCNTILTVLVVLLGLYILLYPFAPEMTWWLGHHSNQPVANKTIRKTVSVQSKAAAGPPIPGDELLNIPRLGMSQIIHTGPSEYELNKGVWLVPKTSTPSDASNTVIIGHRFTYAGPAVFYFLDKVQVGDPIVIDWHNKEYTYKVSTVEVVPPTDMSVTDPSSVPELTLYTCTPLWTAKNRLVIVAPLQEIRS